MRNEVSAEAEKRIGSCACGGVRIRLEREPIIVHCCHCRFCQRMTGSAFGLNAMIERDELTVDGNVSLEAVATPSDHPEGQIWRRCSRCRVPLWGEHAVLGPAIVLVRIGTLDRPDSLTPDIHCYTATRLPWVVIPDGVPVSEGIYDPAEVWTEAAQARVSGAMARGKRS